MVVVVVVVKTEVVVVVAATSAPPLDVVGFFFAIDDDDDDDDSWRLPFPIFPPQPLEECFARKLLYTSEAGGGGGGTTCIPRPPGVSLLSGWRGRDGEEWVGRGSSRSRQFSYVFGMIIRIRSGLF